MKKILFVVMTTAALTACGPQEKPVPVADSGVKKASVKIKTGADGLSVEQRNVKERIKRDNDIGSYKHLYVVSAYSGDVILYSTVKGKVTSSGKRLTNTHKQYKGYGGGYNKSDVMPAIQDDGTYGSSVPYIYWFDSKGVYHQHYVSGGQIVHVADAPISVPKVIINMEVTEE